MLSVLSRKSQSRNNGTADTTLCSNNVPTPLPSDKLVVKNGGVVCYSAANSSPGSLEESAKPSAPGNIQASPEMDSPQRETNGAESYTEMKEEHLNVPINRSTEKRKSFGMIPEKQVRTDGSDSITESRKQVNYVWAN